MSIAETIVTLRRLVLDAPIIGLDLQAVLALKAAIERLEARVDER